MVTFIGVGSVIVRVGVDLGSGSGRVLGLGKEVPGHEPAVGPLG